MRGKKEVLKEVFLLSVYVLHRLMLRKRYPMGWELGKKWCRKGC